MQTIKHFSLGVFHGLWDSIRGMSLVLHIDEEIYRLQAEKEAAKQRFMLERMRRMQRRSLSPTPASAASMAREEKTPTPPPAQPRENPDERSLASVIRKKTPASQEEPKPKIEKKIAKKVLKCCLLNGGFTWTSIILFEQLLLPTLKFILTLCYGEHKQELNIAWAWLLPILSIVFGMMWVLPIFLLSKICSSLWFADIANAAYRVRKGRPQMISSISKLIADFLFSLLVQALFLVQSMLVAALPIPLRVGEILCFVHLCLLYSLYSFEYKWFNMGWELHRRLSYIENNWAYFLGFGLPLTVLTNMSSSVIVSSCIFSIFFPLFILSGNEAKPLVGTTEIPLRLFSSVIFFSNLFFKRSPTRQQLLTAAKVAQQQQQQLQQQSLLKQQQQQQHHHRRSHHHREQQESPKQQQQQQQSQTHRYQQPPMQPQVPPPRTTHNVSFVPSSSSRSSPVRHVPGLRRPLIPTPVPGAPQAPPTLQQR